MVAKQDTAANSAPARKCVLIVEDNALNMKLFSAMISSQGYEVLQAENGARAIDMARTRHPDLIVMDLQLPDVPGLEVTRILKAADETREIQIIGTTAYASRTNETTIRAAGCDAFMAKPIAISEFLELIESLMTREVCTPVA